MKETTLLISLNILISLSGKRLSHNYLDWGGKYVSEGEGGGGGVPYLESKVRPPSKFGERTGHNYYYYASTETYSKELLNEAILTFACQ